MEWIKNNLAIISIYLVTLGIVYLTTYYAYFGVNILSYLDLTEIIQLQFKYYAAAFCIIVLSNLQIMLKNNYNTNDNDDIYNELIKPNKYKQHKILKQFKDNSNRNVFYSVIVICLAFLGAFIYKAITAHYLAFTAIELIFETIILYLFFKILPRYEKLLKSFGVGGMNNEIIPFFGFVIIATIVTSFELARNDAFDLIIKRSENEVTINIDSKSITTNDSLVFAGKTKNYIFFYNRFTEQYDVYAFSSIKSINYRPGKKYKIIPFQYVIGNVSKTKK